MTLRETPSDTGPNACPFVALELDRDRRSEKPDYRHRCYAEQVPAPRTIAHQERFCLSPNFPGCPIFQDWAVRAAARAVPLPQGGRRAAPDPRAVGAADPSPGPSPEQQPDEGWPDSMATSLPVGDAAAAAGGLEPDDADEQQLSAFDAPVPDRVASAPVAPAASSPPAAPMDRGPIDQPRGVDASEPADLGEHEDAAAPAFLAGRSTKPRRSPKVDHRVQRESVVPSWEIDGRFGAEADGERQGGGLFGRLLTIAAVVIILGLGVAAVVLIPGLLAGAPQQTTRPSFAALPSSSPTAEASPVASVIAVVPTLTELPLTTASPNAEPTPVATPGPEQTPTLYPIRSGDTLARIARQNGITVADILAANPEIVNANHIEVGQVIVIPLPPATPAP